LINRNPTGRLICIHALTKYLLSEFGKKAFTITDVKYDVEKADNILNHCDLLIKIPSVGHMVCPYLENPLSDAKCYLTQSVQHDTQKSKSASDAMNALDGLGLASRGERDAKLTERGIEFASISFSSKEWLTIIRESVLGYGPFIGLLYEASQHGATNPRRIRKSDISLGYPTTEETIKSDGGLIQLSTGSQDDTITRTRATLFSWAVLSGFALPDGISEPSDPNLWHRHTLNYVKEEKWPARVYNFYIPDDLFDGTHFVDRPLNYTWMTKSTRALRERGQKQTRDISLKYEPRVQNRRYAVTYALGACAKNGKRLNFPAFIKKLKEYPDLFVIDKNQFYDIMKIEARIAIVAGIPYSVAGNILKPLTRINLKILKIGAPWQLENVFHDILSSPNVMCD